MSAPAFAHAASRGFEELRSVLIELVEEGSALGLTAAELFLQFGDRGCADGIGRRQLREGLASLSVHLTVAEVKTLMTGAGCTGEDEQSPKGSQLLTLERFSAMVEKPTAPPPAVTGGTSAAALSAALDTQQPPSSGQHGEKTPLNHDDNSSRHSAEGDDGCVTPDSLAPRMSLSELLVDVPEIGDSSVAGGDGGGDGEGPGTSSSAAAHVEAFGRVAANVQAVLATAISRSGKGQDAAGTNAGASGGGSGSGRFGGHDQQTSNMSENRNQRSSIDASNFARSSRAPVPEHSSGSVTQLPASRSRAGAAGAGPERTSYEDGEKNHRTEPEQDTAAQRPPSTKVPTTASSRSGPVPRAGAITPPLGSARSPSEPLHPTRASRERLEAALEGLDLKERLRPTTSVGGNGRGGRRGSGGGGGDSGEDEEGSGVHGARSSRRSAGARLPTAGSALSRRLASVDVGGGIGVGGGSRRASAIRMRKVAGVDERGARVRRLSGRASGRAGGVGSGSEQRRRLGEVIDLAAAERHGLTAYDGGSEEAPEVIGRLRSRVVELELSEQLLRCELEGARADLVSRGRQAEEEVQREVDRAKELERTLQSRMGALLRAAEAEANAAEKRMAEIKRTSAAEAAAREKSSADYLRRRLKEVEATLEAKASRRSSLLSKQQHHQHRSAFATSRRRQGRRRESWAEDIGTDSPGGSAGGGAVDGDRGTSGRWARPRVRRRSGAPGELSGGVDGDGRGEKNAAAVIARLREELVSCRNKLAEVTITAEREASKSRLRKEAKRPEQDDPERENQRQTGKQGAEGVLAGGGRRRAGRPGKSCALCGERNRSSREKQRERERRLEARVAESEEARIEVEAEAGRLQAFLEEMRGLGPIFAQP